MTDHLSQRRALVVKLHDRVCALPLTHVIETMRPLPVEPMAGLPSFVRGVSIIRGTPTPVVDLATLLGAPDGVVSRFVTIRLGDRQAALSVGAVLGVHGVDAMTIQELPPLLQEASKDIVETLGTLDAQIVVVLQAGWELPDEVWRIVAAREGAE